FFGAYKMARFAAKLMGFLYSALFTRRGLLVFAGTAAFLYAVIVLLYVQSIPDIGLRSAFSTAIMGEARMLEEPMPREGDVVTEVGDIVIKTWPDLLNAPFRLRDRLRDAGTAGVPWAKTV